MARNEEKQLGRLNRLWLQKEKEEGHIKDIGSYRPRLSALNTASNVKKWIPSIKNEMNYYLEQSQLCHYSERKIAEFQDKIDGLRKEYQSFLWKLRKLDPSCKEHPWKLRGYTRKREVEENLPSWVQSGEHTGPKLLCTPILDPIVRSDPSDSDEEKPDSGEKKELSIDYPNIDPESQDKPLTFNSEKSHPKHVWLRSTYNNLGDDIKKFKDILLANNPGHSGQITSGNGLDSKTDCTDREVQKGILGLDCYGSSEEEE
ncbi:uncharacterized protein RCH25_006043 [Pelodytes ibericus]